jgi:hypothetical protein
MQRPTQYIAHLDKFISPYGVYSCEEIDDLDRMESAWRESLPDYNLNQLLEIFPEAKTIVKGKLKEEIKQCKEDLQEAERVEIEGKNIIEWKSKTENHWFWEGVLEAIILAPLRTVKLGEDLGNGWRKSEPYDRETIIRRNSFFLAGMKRKKEVKTSGVTTEQIYTAKQVPIRNFIKTDRNNKAVCIFHNDKHPSMHIYKDNNYYCFVCNASGDVVDVVMKLRNISFIDAVKSLI